MLTFLDRLLPFMGRLAKRSDLAAPIFVLIVLVVMIMPLPAFMVDLLIVLNITLSLIILMVGMYVPRPKEFSSYPSVLLVVTLFRLSINVATTRRILLYAGDQGPDAAGNMVRSFGQFVVGGSYVVGLVVFLVLLAIQFLVINHGAGRIAEVTARFTLDAMPGKQMAIDADLNAGYIDEQEARRRRKDLQEEAGFYGSMDGAVKFTQRDAVASLIILAVNIVAGIILGVVQYNLPIAQALQTYTLLTVGDGLVTVIPSLLISVGGAILTTRSSADTNGLGGEVLGQLGADARPLFIAAAALFLFGAVPGLPLVPFWVMGAIFGIMAYAAWKLPKPTPAALAAEAAAAEKAKAAAESGERVEDLLKMDLLGLEVGYGLIPMLDVNQGGTVLERIKAVRRQMAQELGIVVPPVRIRDNLQLPPNTYRILLRGEEIARADLLPNQFMAMNPGTATEDLPGAPAKEPAFGLPAYWIPETMKDRAQMIGYTVVEPATVLTTHLSELIKQHAPELLGRSEVQHLLDTLKESTPRLVDEIIPNLLTVGLLQKVMQNLLRERVPVRDLGRILETAADAAGMTKDVGLITEYVRQALGRVLTGPHLSETGELGVLVLDPQIEQTLQGGIEQTDRGSFLALEPNRSQEVLGRIANGIAAMLPGAQPVLLTSPVIRPHLRRLLERALPHLVVLSHSEIPADVRVVNLGTVS
jgi:flagellar biosynthesis protein FlhA